MGWIQSVCGPVSPDALGHCQIHEHIFLRRTPMAERNPALRLAEVVRVLEYLNVPMSCHMCKEPALNDKIVEFLHQAEAQREKKHLTIEDGWTYFIHGWTQVIAEAFHIDITGERLAACDRIAWEMR